MGLELNDMSNQVKKLSNKPN